MKKAIFMVEWKNGLYQLPELPKGMIIDGGVSAMAHITNDGRIRTRIRAEKEVIEELKNHGKVLTFVEYIEDSDE